MKVSVIGSGYVGLVSGVCLAEKGHEVICVDADDKKIAQIQRGVSPIFERGLESLLRKHIGTRLCATSDLRRAVLDTELSLIAVGTPFSGSEIDLHFVRDVAHQLGEILREKSAYHVVVVKSTVVPGTTEDVVLPVLEEASGKKAGVDFGVGMNPEFLTEGEAVGDFMNPDRIVLGGIDSRTIARLEELYAGFEGVETIKTNPRTAEMIKYASNALLATMISFANEIANLGAALGGIDVVDVMRGLHLSNYLSFPMSDGRRRMLCIVSFLAAGCGFGGSCLPKDVKALVAHGRKAGQPMHLLDAVIHVNEHQPEKVISLLKKHLPSLRGIRVAVLGLSFRPNTNDMRESPAIPILRDLREEGAVLKAYDPAARDDARELLRGDSVCVCETLTEAISDAQAIVLVTRWDEFFAVPELLRQSEPQPLFVDGRRMLEKSSFARYEGIGL
ncbi:MAG TPA: UDP-glucose/GDP-mannose dehydrogenase family protein [Candidatus Dormibacteraeota bacterium]|nr:UDP-glucose/GDP-mannose dehydrogenase family protein [Candidatus Dormibacteraeota bacterium]